MFKRILKILLTGFIVCLCCLLSLGWYYSAPAYEGVKSAHFDGRVFYNQETHHNSFWDFLKWISSRKPGAWPEKRENIAYPAPQSRVSGDRFSVTFINHSSMLIQIDGLNILTDPIWSERCSPFSFIGPKRVRAPGIKFEDLPPIDVVLISHNHYDHLDIATLKQLYERDKPNIFAGLGNKALLAKHNINSSDLDWWQSIALSPEVELWAVPAQHFSNRGLSDRNKTLWMGFVLKASGANIYFAGDTGFGSFFEQIYKRFGSMNLALLPIGAFVPTWFMHSVHLCPFEALRAAEILQAKNSLGIHFGTFALADDAEDEPIRELAKALTSFPDLNFHTLDFGQSKEFLKH